MLSMTEPSSAAGIDAANGILHQIAKARGLLDSRAAFGAHMQDELAAIRIGKEVLTEKRNQAQTGCSTPAENRHEDFADRDTEARAAAR